MVTAILLMGVSRVRGVDLRLLQMSIAGAAVRVEIRRVRADREKVFIIGVVVFGLMQMLIDEQLKNIGRVILIAALAIYAIVILLKMAGVALPN
jgi:hypothetical protein